VTYNQSQRVLIKLRELQAHTLQACGLEDCASY